MTDTNKPYFLYSPDNGMEFFATEPEALAAAKKEIPNYRDADEWSLDVTSIIVGKVSHRATEADVHVPNGQLDDEGYDEDGEYFGGAEGFCDYKMLALTGEPK